MIATLQQFTVGNRYALTFVGDADSHVVYEVLSRTVKSVTLTDGKEQITRRVTTFDNSEQVLPFGRYSMAPVLRAEPRTLSGGVRAGELPVGSFHTGR